MDHAYVESYRDGHAHSVGLGGGRLTVGRAATNGLALPADAQLSAEHAVLEPTADEPSARPSRPAPPPSPPVGHPAPVAQFGG